MGKEAKRKMIDRIKKYTKMVPGGEDFCGRARLCLICRIADQESDDVWNKHIARHEKEGLLTFEDYRKYIDHLIMMDEKEYEEWREHQ